jgi:hypothetical protein
MPESPILLAKFAGAFLAIRAAAGVVTAGFDHFRQALMAKARWCGPPAPHRLRPRNS